MTPSSGGERFQVRATPVPWLIAFAYGVSIGQVSGVPRSLERLRFDIDAKCEPPTTRQQMLVRLQRLLEDRLELRFHRETRDAASFVLLVSTGGPKLHENTNGSVTAISSKGPRGFTFTNYTMPFFASTLATATETPVIDKTALPYFFLGAFHGVFVAGPVGFSKTASGRL